jgi:hypothetical protein
MGERLLLIVLEKIEGKREKKRKKRGGGLNTHTPTHTHIFYNFASSGCGIAMGPGAFCVS